MTFSIHQGFAHEVHPERMTDYVNAAFYADVKHELEVALMYHRENSKAIDTLNSYYQHGVVPTDFTDFARVGRAVASSFHMLVGITNDSHNFVPDPMFAPGPVAVSEQPLLDPFGVKFNYADTSYEDKPWI